MEKWKDESWIRASISAHLTKKLAPAVVVLDVDLADESGWLVCDKLNREHSGPKVILVTATSLRKMSAWRSLLERRR